MNSFDLNPKQPCFNMKLKYGLGPFLVGIMSHESLEEEGLEKIPNLELAKRKYILMLPESQHDAELSDELLEQIKLNNMAPWYEDIVKDLGWNKDRALLAAMKEQNTSELVSLEDGLIEAENSLNESEVREAYIKKALYLSKIGDFDYALAILEQIYAKTVSNMHRLRILFHSVRIGFFLSNHQMIGKHLEKAESLIEDGGDWDMRNRFKVYKGLYLMMIKKFKEAAELFLDTTSTFTSYELLDYNTFMRYTVLISVVALNRKELKEKIIHAHEISSMFHTNPDMKSFVFSLYDCQYAEFFRQLANVEELLRKDCFLHPHRRFFVREMKIKAYAQLLESYRSLSLQYMADAFGVTIEFIDEELSKFITSGRLSCKIDKVDGIVLSNRSDLKNIQFQDIIKNGDILLNRVQKLSRVLYI